MPILKSAIKKLRQDRKRTLINRKKKETLKKLVKQAVKEKTAVSIKRAVSFVDKIAKVHLIHKNKAARLKSRLAKITVGKKAPLTK